MEYGLMKKSNVVDVHESTRNGVMVSADTLLSPSLSIIFLRCVITVERLMLRRSAISLFIYPLTMSVITSTSRTDNCFSA